MINNQQLNEEEFGETDKATSNKKKNLFMLYGIAISILAGIGTVYFLFDVDGTGGSEKNMVALSQQTALKQKKTTEAAKKEKLRKVIEKAKAMPASEPKKNKSSVIHPKISATSIDNKEIDRIFMSFADEEARKKAEEKARKKAEEEAKKANKKGKLVRLSKYFAGNTPRQVLPHYGGSTVPEGAAVISNHVKHVKNKQRNIAPKIIKLRSMTIFGISCIDNKCIAATNNGLLVAGSIIGSSEKVIKVTPAYVLTDKRKIAF